MRFTIRHFSLLSLALPLTSAAYLGPWAVRNGNTRSYIHIGTPEGSESRYKNATDPLCQTRESSPLDITIGTKDNELWIFTLCTIQNQWPPLCYWKGQEELDKSENDCPTTDTEMVERLYRKGLAGDVLYGRRSNQGPLTVEKIWEGLYALDEKTFKSVTPPEEVVEIGRKIDQEIVDGLIVPVDGVSDVEPPVAAPVNLIDTPEGGEENDEEKTQRLTQEGVAKDCTKWHLVKEGESCYSISKSEKVELKQLYLWNPAVGKGGECKELWIGYDVCVGVTTTV
ncbi:hypothetical protein BJ508DRAFT_311974 [Ascobolus immersus RN42]|uniref:LysM domain-containing protein n=1 Tax=Ascobolus immersus RN42 TaxID=1160509 RepID=A0A3N4HNQ4_ASCIM|nr:hypothetical protein BJ508DRAFT_311974 [Ascobolus immersus RN42]